MTINCEEVHRYLLVKVKGEKIFFESVPVLGGVSVRLRYNKIIYYTNYVLCTTTLLLRAY